MAGGILTALVCSSPTFIDVCNGRSNDTYVTSQDHIHSLVQFTPSPSNPTKQEHLYDPIVLVQLAFILQLLFPLHSLTSGDGALCITNIEMDKWKNLTTAVETIQLKGVSYMTGTEETSNSVVT